MPPGRDELWNKVCARKPESRKKTSKIFDLITRCVKLLVSDRNRLFDNWLLDPSQSKFDSVACIQYPTIHFYSTLSQDEVKPSIYKMIQKSK